MAIGFLWGCLLAATMLAFWTNKAKAEPMIDPSPKLSFNLFKVATVHAQEIIPDPLPPTVVEAIRYGFGDLGEKIVQEAIKVGRCESGLRETAVNSKNNNKSVDSGIFQINSVHGVPTRFLKDLRINVAMARELYDDQKWQPWASSGKCHGLSHQGGTK